VQGSPRHEGGGHDDQDAPHAGAHGR
jgi:hypothetical protein